jgi:hypothetical protein
MVRQVFPRIPEARVEARVECLPPVTRLFGLIQDADVG